MSTEPATLAISDWPVAILAGGMAKRLRPATETLPKALLTVAGEPFLAHQLRLLHSRGIRRVVLCLGYLGEMIQAQFGDGARYGMKIEYSFDGPELRGTGGALKRALPALDGQFFVLYGDSYLPIYYGSVARAFYDCRKPALMTVFKNENRWDLSNVSFDGQEIRCYDKKNRTEAMHYIDYGLGVFRAEVLARWPNDKPFDLADLYRDLVAKKQLAGFEVKQRFYEIGSPEGLTELDSLLRKPVAFSS
jgi:N-acetyl-alpha-D-muramate 1-phosphate uridylyltransferase